MPRRRRRGDRKGKRERVREAIGQMNIEGERKLEYGKSKMEGEKRGRVWETKVRVFM